MRGGRPRLAADPARGRILVPGVDRRQCRVRLITSCLCGAFVEPGAGRASATDAQALVRDSLLLADAGLLSMAEALVVADGAMRHASPNVALTAIKLLEGLRDEWLGAPEVREKARIVAERVVPRARSLGWSRKAGDSDDLHALRAVLLRYAADRPEGASLRAEARALALRWLDDPGRSTRPCAIDLETGRGSRRGDIREAAGGGWRRRIRRRSQLLGGARARARPSAARTGACPVHLTHPRQPMLAGRWASRCRKALRTTRTPRGLRYVRRHLDGSDPGCEGTPAALSSPSRPLHRPRARRARLHIRPPAQRYMTDAPARASLESIDCV